jgi:hypothetical protein
MNHVERFANVMSFKPVDRMPVIEWAGYWNLTLDRWRREGLPAELKDAAAIREHLGLDPWRQLWIRPRAANFPKFPKDVPPVRCAADYDRLMPHLYPEPAFDPAPVREWADRRRRGDAVVWISLDGFFWFPRTLFGIEGHLYAFYDQPDLMRRMNEDLLRFNLRAVEAFCRLCRPDFMTFGEDMSYNHGPMLSKALFDEFLAPCYRRIVPALKERGILPLVDSDGDVAPLIPWLQEVGLEGILPLERRALVDAPALRRAHPQWRMIGAFDKTVMHLGEGALRAEFERLLPLMRGGGCIVSCDHQTPPEVSLADYRLYVRLLREYAERAAR